MKKLIKYFGIALLSILAIIILILGALSFKYSPRYVYRLARYHVADVYDYIHFKNRVIEAADRAFSFSRNLDEPYVEDSGINHRRQHCIAGLLSGLDG